MRDLLVLAVIYGSLPVIVFRPFFGLLVYGWLSYMRPQDMAWAVRGLPLSQWVAIAMLVGLVLTLGRERWLTIRAQTVLLILLAAWISLSAIQAVKPEAAGLMYGYYWKTILIALLTTGLVTSRHRFRILILLIVGSHRVPGRQARPLRPGPRRHPLSRRPGRVHVGQQHLRPGPQHDPAAAGGGPPHREGEVDEGRGRRHRRAVHHLDPLHLLARRPADPGRRRAGC